MGDHSKPGVWSVLDWARTHKKTVIAVAAGVVAIVSAVRPDFPGAAVMGALSMLLGA